MFRAGICGLGTIGNLHAGHMLEAPGVDLVAVCDILFGDSAAARMQREATRGPFAACTANPALGVCARYSDIEEMLAAERLDLLLIATPTDLHAQQSVTGLEAGCHVFCEKPMALTVEDCDAMIAARDRCGRQLMIGQCIRFWPDYCILEEVIEDRRYGSLQSLYMERMGPPAQPRDSWFNDHTRSGGAAVDLHVHDVDWVNHVLGRPDGVYRIGKIGDTGGIDDVTSVWEYRDGPAVTLRASWMYYPRFRMGYRALFENATVEFEYGAPIAVHHVGSGIAEEIATAQYSAYLREFDYFLECASGQTENTRCNAESSRDAIELVLFGGGVHVIASMERMEGA
jgi:predicted dehydrogenase